MVAAHHADQRDAVNVVALGDHLRAHQQIDFARVQARQQPLEIVASAHGVAIHAADARAGKDLRRAAPRPAGSRRRGSRDARSRTWGSAPERCGGSRNSGTRAADPRAPSPVFRRGFVMRESNGAVLALELFAAGAADHGKGVAAAIEQNQRLLAAFERRLASAAPASAKRAGPARFPGTRAACRSARPRAAGGSSRGRATRCAYTCLALDIVPAFQRRRGRAQHHHRTGQLGAHHGHVARVVARRLLLLVALVVLLVHQDRARDSARAQRSPSACRPRWAPRRGECAATARCAPPA